MTTLKSPNQDLWMRQIAATSLRNSGYAVDFDLGEIKPLASTGMYTFLQKYSEGRYFGTGYGEYAVNWYAQRQVTTGNPLWAVPGSIAALWTPETYQQTAWTLITGYQIGGYLGRPFYQYYPKGNEGYTSPYLTRGWGWKQPYSTGREAFEALRLDLAKRPNPGTAVRQMPVKWWKPIAGPQRVPGGTGTEYYRGRLLFPKK